jgi:hypothetical protein
MKEVSLLFNYLLSESRIIMIKELHGSVDNSVQMKSVKSIHPRKSVIQTSYDIIKANGGEIKVETKKERAAPLLFNCPLHKNTIIMLVI